MSKSAKAFETKGISYDEMCNKLNPKEPSLDEVKQHLDHQFYIDARAYTEKIRVGQILKGAEKYPEPFTTESWTNEEIVVHAMQENVDQTHYIYACKERMEQQHNHIEMLRNENEKLHKLLEDVTHARCIEVSD